MKGQTKNLNSEFKTRPEAIEWRRNKVIELKAQGLDQIEIARVLHVSPATITFDLQYLRNEALENVRDYTTRELPLQYKVFIKALQQAIQTYWRLSIEARDDANKIHAMEHFIDSHQTLWSLLLGGERFENARQFESKLASDSRPRPAIILDDTDTEDNKIETNRNDSSSRPEIYDDTYVV